MYIEAVPNRNSRPATLLRQGWREGKRVRKKTLANLSDWPAEKVEALRQVLKGQRLIAPEDAFAVERSLPHGHVEALLAMTRRLGLERLVAPKRCPERDRVLAMVLERVLHPASKLATTRLWHSTTLAEELGVGDDDEDGLYEAMDWLLKRQERIEQRLARRHLHEGEPVFADVSSSYYEGRTCPLMRFGYNRDGIRSTVVTSQLPVEKWHDVVGDPTLADAILDRLVHSAHQINLNGESMRKRPAALTQTSHRGS